MKYKRRKKSKHNSRTARSNSAPKPARRAVVIAAVIFVSIPFIATRLTPAECAYVKTAIFKYTVSDIRNSEFFDKAAEYISGFCFGYLKGNETKKESVYADSEPAELPPPEATPATNINEVTETEPIFAPATPCIGTITSAFGERLHPITNEVKFHNGIDIALKEGDEIYAAFDGTVVKSEYNSSSGNHIVIKHSGGYTSSYAHMSELISPVGCEVKKGDIIGLGGSTGGATGPHLHFEIRLDGTPLDPTEIMK